MGGTQRRVDFFVPSTLSEIAQNRKFNQQRRVRRTIRLPLVEYNFTLDRKKLDK